MRRSELNLEILAILGRHAIRHDVTRNTLVMLGTLDELEDFYHRLKQPYKPRGSRPKLPGPSKSLAAYKRSMCRYLTYQTEYPMSLSAGLLEATADYVEARFKRGH